MADESRRRGRIGGLRAGYDCGTCADMLEDIKSTPRGNDIRLPIGPNTTSGVRPRQGGSPGRQADTAVVGGPAGGGHAGISQSVVDLSQIPVDNPYEYEPIHPYDDRYDFRLGKKVNDIGINGINPLGPQSFPPPQSQFDNPGVQTTPSPDAGDPRGPDQIPDVGTGDTTAPPIEIGFGVGQVDPALAAALPTPPTEIGFGVGQVDPALAAATGATTSRPLPAAPRTFSLSDVGVPFTPEQRRAADEFIGPPPPPLDSLSDLDIR